MIKKYLVIIFLTAAIIVPAASQDFGKVHELIVQGIDAEYNMDFPLALTKFQEAKNIAPNDLRGHFFVLFLFEETLNLLRIQK